MSTMSDHSDQHPSKDAASTPATEVPEDSALAAISDFEALKEGWESLTPEERSERFNALPRLDGEELFLNLSARLQAELLSSRPRTERRSWIRLLAPDDTADLIQELEPDGRYDALSLLDEGTRREVTALLAYAEDDAGGLMNSRYIRLRPEMSVDEAIRYIRAQARTPVETISYAYVLDQEQSLLGVVTFRTLFLAPPDRIVRDLMTTDLVVAPEDLDQEEVSRLFAQNDLLAIPVVDANRHMKGIVTVDDVVSVVQEEATEDIQKLGGTSALDAPYLSLSLSQIIKKRAGWLMILFVGSMLTATAMAHYADEIARAVVLALFIPLIISSGGNAGSQATSLIIRSMALHEIHLRDWRKVLMREIASGLILGLILGVLGFARIMLWPTRAEVYGPHYARLAVTVSFSLIFVVLWGSVSGSMLPFVMRKLKFDPASASAPFVATIVDVTGLIIYFTVASLILYGTVI